MQRTRRNRLGDALALAARVGDPVSLGRFTTHMNSKQTALIALVATGVGATVLGAYTATSEVITQLIVGVAAFLAAGIVLLVLLWTPWLRALPPERQHRIIWIAAGGTSLVVCLLPLMIGILSR